MFINVAKCVYIDIWDTKLDRYGIGEEPVIVVRSRYDLGVTVIHHLETMAHCRTVTVKEFRSLGALGPTFTKLDTNIFTIVYTTLWRSKLENCV